MTADNPCPVAPAFRLDYRSAHIDAEERLARGEEQVKCATCERWCWPDHAKTCPEFRGAVP